MSALTPVHLAIATLDFAVMTLWGVMALQHARALATGRERGPISRLRPPLGVALVVIYLTAGLFALSPLGIHSRTTRLSMLVFSLNDVAGFAGVAIFRNLSWYFGPPGSPPTRLWLAVNYVPTVVLSVIALAGGALLPVASGKLLPWDVLPWDVLTWAYLALMFGLILSRLFAVTRGSAWRAGALGTYTRPDLVVMGAALAILLAVVALATRESSAHDLWLQGLMALFGGLVALPLAVRDLGAVIRDTLLALLSLAIGAAIAGLDWWLIVRLAPAAERPALFVFLLATTFLFVTGPVREQLEVTLDRALFRRSWDRLDRLLAALRQLSPELGREDAGRKALESLIQLMGLDGAALLLRDDGEIEAGRIDIGPLAEAWPRGGGADGLVERPLVGGELSLLPRELRLARAAAGIVAVFRVEGTAGLRGHLVLVNRDLVGASLREHDIQTIEAFCHQLGLLFDGVDLLERAVDVERNLGHAEKLATVGELAARIAHEIRNPITAARSLAQQLVRECDPRFREEHQLILEELERVERQVQALLRYARRDELDRKPVDLGEFVRTTARQVQPRLGPVGIELCLSTPGGVIASVDRERLRGVLVNLVENARDALAGVAGERHLNLGVTQLERSARIRVSDSGPGVPEDELARIFEPFVSTKSHGTGLGLAIARRTIEAHGGQIRASRALEGGLCFEIDLPLEIGQDGAA